MTRSRDRKKTGGRIRSQTQVLKGWQQIGRFLGEPPSVVHRWASEGMPVRREGRFVTTTPDELNMWLGKQSGKPVHVATDIGDLTSELKRGLSFIRAHSDRTPSSVRPASREATNSASTRSNQKNT